MGRYDLSCGSRNHDPDHRLDRGTLRSQALFSDLDYDLHYFVGDVRRGAIARSNGGIPLPAGNRGSRAATALASDSDGNLSAQRADARDGGLGLGPDGRANHGTDGRRLYHRQLEL